MPHTEKMPFSPQPDSRASVQNAAEVKALDLSGTGQVVMQPPEAGAVAPEQDFMARLTPGIVSNFSRLGGVAIARADVDAGFVTQYGSSFNSHEAEEIPKILAEQSLASAKQEQAVLRELAKEHRIDRFADGLHKLDPVPPYLYKALGVPEGDDKALTHAVITTPLDLNNTPTIINFFQWHDGALLKRQEQFEQNDKLKMLADFGARLRRAALDGTIPTKAVWRFRELVSEDKLLVRLSDTTLTRDYNGSTVHFRNGQELVELEIVNGKEKQEHTATHELIHTLSGRLASPTGKDEKGVSPKTERGLYRLFGNGGGRALDEATTEHLADSLIYGHPEVTWPSSEERKHSESYVFSRSLLGLLCSWGEKPISPKRFIHAMLEDGDPQTSPAIKTLESELRQAFPRMNIIERIKKIDGDEADMPEVLASLVQEIKGIPLEQSDDQRPQVTIRPSRLRQLLRRGKTKASS